MSRPTGYVWTPGNRADQAIYLRHLLSAVEDERGSSVNVRKTDNGQALALVATGEAAERIQLTLDEREAGPAYKPEFEGNPDEEHF
jgi:hypothetical protein